MSDWNTYREVFKSATTEVRLLLGSDAIALLVDDIEKRASNNINRQTYLILISDFILGLTDNETFELLLKRDLDSNSAQEIIQKINSMISENNRVKNLDQPVTPVRTMANDMEVARDGQTYTSSQEALLHNVPTPTNPPAPPEPPTWEQPQ